MIEFDSATTHRLPVYVLVDTSGSMGGDGIEAVNQGLQLLLAELKNDPMALETTWIACLSFDSTSREILPLTEIAKAQLPPLAASGNTNLAAGLRLLLQKLSQEVRPNSPEQKGDYKPLIFIMSDGQPTEDQWPSVAAELREKAARKTANVIALACGRGLDTNVLKQLTSTVLLMPDVTPDVLRSFFKWISQSVKVTSRSAGSAKAAESGAVELPPLPTGIQVVL
jgi:uncharacterized protein YegL